MWEEIVGCWRKIHNFVLFIFQVFRKEIREGNSGRKFGGKGASG